MPFLIGQYVSYGHQNHIMGPTKLTKLSTIMATIYSNTLDLHFLEEISVLSVKKTNYNSLCKYYNVAMNDSWIFNGE